MATPGQQAVPPPPTPGLLNQYRDTSAKPDGFISIEVFEQLGRAVFTVVEVWRTSVCTDPSIETGLERPGYICKPEAFHD